jgi:hypothetical protein
MTHQICVLNDRKDGKAKNGTDNNGRQKINKENK